MRFIKTAVLIIGLCTLSAQIILIRELTTLFNGNELAAGIILASWLVWSAAGSFMASYFSERTKHPVDAFARAAFVLGIMTPATIIFIRIIHPAVYSTAGEITGLTTVLFYSFLIPVPLCLINGFLFALGSLSYSIYKQKTAISGVYTFETIGAAAGGVLTSFFFTRYLDSLSISVFLLICICLAVIALNYALGAIAKPFKTAYLTVFIILLFIWLVLFGKEYSSLTRKLYWKNTQLILSRESVYGSISVTKDANQINFFENGLFLFSVGDRLSAEFSVQGALLSHPNPADVLVIGGYSGDIIEEVFKHKSVNTLTFIAADPILAETALNYLTEEQKGLIGKNRVFFEHGDGRRFIKKTKRRFDCVILNIPNPYTLQLNRFYTRDFFLEVKKILSPNGVFSCSLVSAADYIGDELKNLIACVIKTLESVFLDVMVIPTDTLYILASVNSGILHRDYSGFEETLKERGISLNFFRSYYLSDMLSENRLRSFNGSLEKARKSACINTDFFPAGFLLNLIFWNTQFNDPAVKVLKAAKKIDFSWTYSLLFTAVLLFTAFLLLNRTNKIPVLISLFTGGFAGITYQMIFIISFQIIFGYVYHKMGIIFSAFLIGSAAGSAASTHAGLDRKAFFAQYLFLQIAFTLYSFALLSAVNICRAHATGIGGLLAENALLLFLPLSAGFLGGYQFGMASKLVLRETRTAETAGLCYGMDLLGAFAGALVVSFFILPVFGINKTILFTGVLNLSSLIVLLSRVVKSCCLKSKCYRRNN